MKLKRIFRTVLACGVMAPIVCVAQESMKRPRITPQKSSVDASFRGLATRSGKEAWISGSPGVVLRTVDGGGSWTRVAAPGGDDSDFRDIAIRSDGSVLLMSVGAGEASRVYRSTDSGRNWQTVLTNPSQEGFFDGIALDRNDSRRGVLFGDPVNGRMEMYRTSDGGKSWEKVPVENCPAMVEGEYGFAASGTGIKFVGESLWVATGGSTARVLSSTDDGKSWTALKTPVRSGNESSGIFSLEVADSKRLIVIGGDYMRPELDTDNLAMSSDGGRTWSTPASVSMPHKACVRSLGGSSLLACGRTGVAYSSDFGRTWTVLTTDAYYTMDVELKSGVGFMAGPDGHVARIDFQSLR